MRIQLDLPFPPSVNRLWRQTHGRVYLNPRYVKWKKHADAYLLMQMRNLPVKRITGNYSLTTLLVKPDNKHRDLNNFSTKAIEDFLVSRKLIDDDSLCQESRSKWVTTNEAPIGCRVIIQTHTTSSKGLDP